MLNGKQLDFHQTIQAEGHLALLYFHYPAYLKTIKKTETGGQKLTTI